MLEFVLQAWLISSIEGRLWNPVTGAPVRKADVMVGTADGRPVKRAISDANGRYLVEGLPAGRYRVAAGRAGYLPAIASNLVVLRAEETRRDVNLAMEFPAVIAGRVLDADGEPVERLTVTAIRREGENVDRAGTAVTNDRGEYRIAGLAPGSYTVRSAGRAVGDEQVYGPVYYPGTADWADSVVVNVGRGGEAQAIDLRVERVAAGTFTGLVRTLSHQVGQLAFVQISRRAPDAVMALLPEREMQVVVGETFMIPKLAPGQYMVEARAEGANHEVNWALQEALVAGTGQQVTELTLLRGLELTATLEPDQQAALSLTRVGLARQEADAKGRFHNLTPGTWQIQVNGLAPNRYVDRVFLGDREMPGGLIPIRGGLLPKLRILVSDAAGTVEGAAREEGTAIALEPESTGGPLRTMAGAEGRFRLQGLRPGKYRLRCGEQAGEVFDVKPRMVEKRDCGS